MHSAERFGVSESEMQKCGVIGEILFAAGQVSAQAIHPIVSSFDDPTASAIARASLSFGSFLAARLDVSCVAPLHSLYAHTITHGKCHPPTNDSAVSLQQIRSTGDSTELPAVHTQ